MLPKMAKPTVDEAYVVSLPETLVFQSFVSSTMSDQKKGQGPKTHEKRVERRIESPLVSGGGRGEEVRI
jgi:hypothetical protein